MEGRRGITLKDIAAKYGVSPDGVATWTLRPEWKKRVRVIGTLGRANEYHPKDVDALVREWMWLPPTQTNIPRGQLLTLKEIAEYTGIGYATVRSDAVGSEERPSRLGEPDDVQGRARLWRRETVDKRYRGKQLRRRKPKGEVK